MLQERITSTKTGSITSIQAVYVPAYDLTDPSPATMFAHLDATVVLSRQIASLGIYPAVDPLDRRAGSSIRSSSARITTTPRGASRRSCSATRSCRTSSPFSAWTNYPKMTSFRFTAHARSSGFLLQPFNVAKVFTGQDGKIVPLADTIRGFKAIIAGEYDHLSEQAFYMVGGIEEAVEKAKTL